MYFLLITVKLLKTEENLLNNACKLSMAFILAAADDDNNDEDDEIGGRHFSGDDAVDDDDVDIVVVDFFGSVVVFVAKLSTLSLFSTLLLLDRLELIA